MSKFEVQEYTVIDGWTNTWSDGEGNPSYFDNELDALEELDRFFKDMQRAFECGDMADVPSPDDYRIVEVRDEKV